MKRIPKIIRENEKSGSVLKVVSPLLEWDCKGNKKKEMCALFHKLNLTYTTLQL